MHDYEILFRCVGTNLLVWKPEFYGICILYGVKYISRPCSWTDIKKCQNIEFSKYLEYRRIHSKRLTEMIVRCCALFSY
jgi:hypothetical protein